jgi:hypothetical protein
MERVERYFAEGFGLVEGWLDPFSAKLIAHLCKSQRTTFGRGALGEIGVHHGKLFIVMAACAAPDERLFAIDVFGRSELNLDRSGAGDESRFRANTARWAGRDDVHVIADSSLNVRAAQITAACGPVRMLSIDGGHTAACAENDLKLGEAVLREDGIAILDDVFNFDWPGVVTGAARYWAEGGALQPFALTPSKVFVARGAAAAAHKSELRRRFGAYIDKDAEMFGAAVDIYHDKAQSLRNAIKSAPGWPSIAPFARSAWRALRRR